MRLRELDGVDLFDVLHYLFEDDMSASSVEHHDARALFRRQMYPEMLGIDAYEWLTPSEAQQTSSGQATVTFGGDVTSDESVDSAVTPSLSPPPATVPGLDPPMQEQFR